MHIVKFLKIYKYIAVIALTIILLVGLLCFLFKLLNKNVVLLQREATATVQISATTPTTTHARPTQATTPTIIHATPKLLHKLYKFKKKEQFIVD